MASAETPDWIIDELQLTALGRPDPRVEDCFGVKVER